MARTSSPTVSSARERPGRVRLTLAREQAEREEVWRGFWVERADGITLVAEQDGRFVAMACGGPAPGHPEVAGIFGMWVDPIARRRGIGAALIDSLLEWVRDAGYRQIGLGVTTANPSAIALYSGLGFVDTGERAPLRDGSSLTMQIMIASVPPTA